MTPSPTHRRMRRPRAFTLIEILTAITITTVIVFTLVSMFNTSTRALRIANRQTDVWEAARSTFGILRNDISEVTVGGLTNRINLFAANGPSRIALHGEPMRLQDVYVLSRDENQWKVNIFMLGKDRKTDPDDTPVLSLYRFQTNYPVYVPAGSGVLDIDQPLASPSSTYSIALAALDKHLSDLDKGIEPDRSVNIMTRGIVHLRLVAYDADGRAFYPTNAPDYEIFNEAGPPYRDRLSFTANKLPASLDLEMFVLEPDRIEELRAQRGSASASLYMSKHENSVQMFRTRIAIHRDLLARQ
jgi:type II secretory pathway pseudopilin PulG